MKRSDDTPSPPGDTSLPVTRRDFVTGLVGAGFALATQPIAARTAIFTNGHGLLAGDVVIPVSDGEMAGYRAKPASGSAPPVILVVHEIFGVHEHIKDVCRRLAKLGYLAVAPDLFARQGDVSRLSSIDAIRPVVAKVPDAQVLSDLDACMTWAATDGGNTGRLGITGFCWGGRITWLYTAHQPAIKAAVAWYGKLTGPVDPLRPLQPLDIAATLVAPVLGLYGAEDQSIPLPSIASMRAALHATGGRSEIVIYPGAGHAFFADYRPSYRKSAAEDGWMRMQRWFMDHGV